MSTVTQYRRLAGAKVRSDAQYRVSFAVFTVATFSINLLDFVGIAVLFTNTGTLGGWSLREVAFLYGIAGLCFGLGDLLVGSVESLSPKIRDGSFDVILTRPVNSLVYLTASEFNVRRLAKAGQGAAILAVAIVVNDIDWNPERAALLLTAIATGTIIASSVWVATSSISFWLVNSREVANTVTYGGGLLVGYPIHLFDRWLRAAFTYLFPLVFVSYVPTVAILSVPSPLGLPSILRWAGVPVAIAAVVVARTVWRRGLRHYASTGS